MHAIEIIEKKRDKGQLTKHEINYLVGKFVDGTIPDYQIAAFLMATCINGMHEEEISWLTDAMLYSGEVISHNKSGTPLVDKHSTGGVGDKVSIPLAPAIAALGLKVPMIAGRGLGHTGGTLDKLEAILGFRTDLSSSQFQEQVEKIGCAIMGQTKNIAPADKKLYALRDVTATVPSIPLISSSIMSKKLAEGIDGLVLDVKFGSGAFMQQIEKARDLARTMVAIGGHLGTKVTACLTNMDQPLGRMIGNTLEIIESIEILHGHGPKDTVELTVELGAEMLLLGNMAKNLDEGRKLVRKVLSSGRAFEKFVDMVKAQGGDIRYLYEPNLFGKALHKIVLHAQTMGFVEKIDCHSIGFAASILGGGRCHLTDIIDHAVGIEMHVKIGDSVDKNQPLCTVHANAKGVDEAVDRLKHAFLITSHPVLKPKLYEDRITNNH